MVETNHVWLNMCLMNGETGAAGQSFSVLSNPFFPDMKEQVRPCWCVVKDSPVCEKKRLGKSPE
jgi:hypothetical protein